MQGNQSTRPSCTWTPTLGYGKSTIRRTVRKVEAAVLVVVTKVVERKVVAVPMVLEMAGVAVEAEKVGVVMGAAMQARAEELAEVEMEPATLVVANMVGVVRIPQPALAAEEEEG